MRKLMLLLAIVPFSINTYSQKSIGGGLCYGTGNYAKNVGISIKTAYQVSPEIVVSPDFSLFFPERTVYSWGNEEHRSFFTLNVNGHYLFLIEEKIEVYPLSGLNISFHNVKSEVFTGITNNFNTTNTFNTEVGLNIGAGGKYKFSDKLSAISEIKYVISLYDQAVVMAGITYSL